MARARRQPRGQAATELAVLSIVLIPLILYVLFLDDLLRYKLDLAEAVFSSPWDYTVANYEKQLPQQSAGDDAPNAIDNMIRNTYCDHTSAYASHDEGYDCDDSRHHVALMAHQCWETQGSQEMRCTVDNRDLGASQIGLLITRGTVDEVNKYGGQVTCTARLGVLNYFLPQKVLSQFSNVDTTRVSMRSGDVHSAASSAGSDQYLLESQTMSLLVDTWAMTTVADVDRNNSSGVLVDRAKGSYSSIAAGIAVGPFALQLVSKQLLSPQALFELGAFGDDTILNPNFNFKTKSPPEDNDAYFSPWRDDDQNRVEKSANQRGDHYWGLEQIPN